MLNDAWTRISTGAWLADVGIPLGVTVIALLISVYFLNHQLRHDRMLAQEERQHAHGQRRADRAERIAESFEDSLDRVGSRLKRNGEADAWWDQAAWPDFEELQRHVESLMALSFGTISRRQNLLPSKMHEIHAEANKLLARLKTIDNEWRGLRHLQDHYEEFCPATIASTDWSESVRSGRRRVVQRRSAVLAALARDLREWDGMDPFKYRMATTTDVSLTFSDAAQRLKKFKWESGQAFIRALLDDTYMGLDEDSPTDETWVTYETDFRTIVDRHDSLRINPSPSRRLYVRLTDQWHALASRLAERVKSSS